MNKLTRKMSLFGKGRKAVVNFIDIDDDLANIGTSGELEGSKDSVIDYDSAAKIKELEDKGYELVENNFDPDGKKPLFSDESTTPYVISFRHGHEVVDVNNPGYGFNKDDLQKVGTQTVHYSGAGNRTPADTVTHVTFDHTIVIDKVTKEMIKDEGWEPESQSHFLIGVPTLPGFVPDESVVGGELVTAQDPDREYSVEYDINRDPDTGDQSAVIKFVDITDNNHEIASETLTGKANMPINYDPVKKVNELKEKGYALVNNGFNADDNIQFFGSEEDYVPTFIMTMKHELIKVDVDHPNDKVKKNEYYQETTFAVDFEGAGDNTPVNDVQLAVWTRSITVVAPTGEVIENGKYTTDWTVDPSQFHNVKVPVIAGYHTEVKEVSAEPITREDRIVNVNYVQNGRIIPVDEDGKEIEGAKQLRFITLNNDPTKVMADEIVPDVDGYTCDLMTITPHNPAKDVRVTYKAKKRNDVLVIPVGEKKKQEKKSTKVKMTSEPAPTPEVVGSNAIEPEKENSKSPEKPAVSKPETTQPVVAKANEQTVAQTSEQPKMETQTSVTDTETKTDNANEVKPAAEQAHDQVAIINFIDVDKNGAQLTSSGPLVGKPGESINDLYSTEIPLKAIKDAGYEIVFNNFDREGVVQRFDNNDLMTQIFTIGVRKKQTKKQKNSNKKYDKKDNNKRQKRTSQRSDVTSSASQMSERQRLYNQRSHYTPQSDRIRQQPVHQDHVSNTAAMVLGVAATVISLIGLTGKRK